MEQLINKLNSLPNTYYEFVDSVTNYAKSKPEHFVLLKDYLDHNPSATVTDVLRLISTRPDFFDDDVNTDILVG